MSSLYQLTASYRALLDTLADGDFDAATISDTIEASGIVDDMQDKAQGYEYVARSLEAETPAMMAEIERLQARIASRAKSAQALRESLLTHMRGAGLDKIESAMFTFSVRKNPHSVEISDAAALPPIYWHLPEPKPPVAAPDKKKIIEALKAGGDVPGARLSFSTRLEIK